MKYRAARVSSLVSDRSVDLIHGEQGGVVGGASSVQLYSCLFFFQAEDGIRDYKVTGVQTCALPIFINDFLAGMQRWASNIDSRVPFPNTVVTGLSVNPGTEGYFLENNNSFQTGDNMSLVKGRHAIKWGTTIYRIQINANSSDFPFMQFNSLDDFVNDRLAIVNISAAIPGNGTRATQIGVYVQDSFQVRPTLKIGRASCRERV